MMKKPVLMICLCTSVFFGCKSVKESGSAITEIHFGTGGGVTGTLDDNHIGSDGAVYHHEKYIRTLAGEELEKVLSTAQSLEPDTIKDLGNFYYYINFKDKEVTYNFVWSNKSVIKPQLKNWYNLLITYSKTDE